MLSSDVLLKGQKSNAVGRKKSERKTTLTRLYETSAQKMKHAASERQLTVAEFFERLVEPCVEKAHRDYIKAESKKIAGDGEK
jgi:hypothetical protein